jgi:hypothetical protein
VDASPRLRVAGVRSPRAAYRADPGASSILDLDCSGDTSRKGVEEYYVGLRYTTFPANTVMITLVFRTSSAPTDMMS